MSRDPFRRAAQAYLAYGIVYWIGGVYLAWHGVGVSGSGRGRGLAAILLGTTFLVCIPMLLARPRPWFERRVLSRRSFARLLVLFLIVRAYKVGQVAFRSQTATVAGPGGGEITYRAGATVFLVITIAALLVIARAAWSTPPPSSRPGPDTVSTTSMGPSRDARLAPCDSSGPDGAAMPMPDIAPLPARSSAPAPGGGLLRIKPLSPRSTTEEGSTPARP